MVLRMSMFVQHTVTYDIEHEINEGKKKAAAIVFALQKLENCSAEKQQQQTAEATAALK